MRQSKGKTALGIVRREWSNLRAALTLCGDIGDFAEDDFIISDHGAYGWTGSKPPLALADALEMNRWMKRTPAQPYHSISASHLYLALGTIAGQRLKFDDFFSTLFGDGIAIVRSRFSGAFGNCAFEEEQFENTFNAALNLRKTGDARLATMETLFQWRFDDVDVQHAFKACFDLLRDWIENPVEYQAAKEKFWRSS